MSGDVVILQPEDAPDLLAHLDAHPDLTMEIRIAWHAQSARFAASRRDGAIVAVAAHDRNGAVLVHAPEALPDLVRACVRDGAAVTAVGGPPEQVRAAITVLGMDERPVARENREIVMALDMDALVLPELLSHPDVVVRRAVAADLPLLTEWRIRYFKEVHRMVADEELIAEVKRDQELGRLWVLEEGGQIVNTAAFCAVFPTILQIEYAYSPPELRSKQYGRSAVAGACAVARAEGIRRAVFNTHEKNKAVQVGIDPIGFRTTQKFLVVVFAA